MPSLPRRKWVIATFIPAFILWALVIGPGVLDTITNSGDTLAAFKNGFIQALVLGPLIGLSQATALRVDTDRWKWWFVANVSTNLFAGGMYELGKWLPTLSEEAAVTATNEIKPHPIERWIERSLPGYRFGLVLVLLLITFAFMASGVTGAWVRVATVALQGLTLLAALRASQVSRRRFRFAALVVLIAFISSVASLFLSSSDSATGAFFALNALIVAVSPVVIARALWRRSVVDLHTALGALCIYVLVGMLFAFTYASIGYLGDEPFFVQTNHATIAEYLYFSFITLTTVGYGDFSAAHGGGRSLAALEALIGQIYLVTVVAATVSSMVRPHSARAGESGAQTGDAPTPTST